MDKISVSIHKRPWVSIPEYLDHWPTHTHFLAGLLHFEGKTVLVPWSRQHLDQWMTFYERSITACWRLEASSLLMWEEHPLNFEDPSQRQIGEFISRWHYLKGHPVFMLERGMPEVGLLSTGLCPSNFLRSPGWWHHWLSVFPWKNGLAPCKPALTFSVASRIWFVKIQSDQALKIKAKKCNI